MTAAIEDPTQFCCLNFGCENPEACREMGHPCGWTAEQWSKRNDPPPEPKFFVRKMGNHWCGFSRRGAPHPVVITDSLDRTMGAIERIIQRRKKR